MSHHKSPGPYAGKGDLTQGPVGRHLVRLTIPMIWGILAMISFQLVDMYYISLLGTQALAAITFTFPVTYVVFSMVMGMSIATSSVISRQIGQGNPARVRRLTTHALLLAFAMGIIVAIAGIAFMGPIFSAMGATEEMMPVIHSFMLIWFAGSIFINTPIVGNAAIRATGDTLFPALVMVFAALLNAALDPILIFGLFGFPRLEVQGAAIATVFSNALALIAGLYVLIVRKKMMTRSRRHLRLFGDSAKRFLFIAIPAGLTSMIQPLTNAVIIALLAGYGTEAVAAFGIVTRVEAFAFVTIMGLAVGMAPIIGQNAGAGQYGRVRETLKKALTFAAAWSLLIALILGLFARDVAALFSEDQGVIAVAAQFFWIVPATYILGNLVPGWGSAFNALGRPQRSFMMIFVKLFVINVPLAYIGAHFYGVVGIFYAIALTNIIAGSVFHLWNRYYCFNVLCAGKES